jgi:hypothetical protein
MSVAKHMLDGANYEYKINYLQIIHDSFIAAFNATLRVYKRIASPEELDESPALKMFYFKDISDYDPAKQTETELKGN